MVNKGVVYIGDISGNLGTINTSGQLRVEAAVSIPPVSANVSGNSVYLPNDGVNNVVSISGQTVVASVNVAANVSGNTIYTVDDGVRNIVKISGQTVVASVVSGFSTTRDISGSVTNISGNHVSVSGIVSVNALPVISISGNAILISGQTVAIAGGINVSGSPVRVSGETVYLVSGNNVVQISGQTVTVANAVSTGVSGQTIYLVNDSINNVVKISGQLVAVSGSVAINNVPNVIISGGALSGLPVTGSFTASISGQPVLISGQTVVASVVTNISGQVVAVSGTTVYLIDDSVNNKIKISGQLVAVSGIVNIGNASIAVTLPAVPTSGDASRISGQTIYTVDDSINNKVKISGQTVSVSGSISINNASIAVTTSVSGQPSPVSGQTVYLVDDSVNNKIKISGQVVAVSGIVNIGNTLTIGTLPVISISGNAVKVSGETLSVSGIVAVNSLPVISVSGSLVSVSGSIAVNSLPVISVSGNAVRTSGQTAYLVNDGVNNVVQISGQTVVGSFTASVSGQPVRTSGQVSYFVNDGVNNVVWISGQVVTATLNPGPTNISGQMVYFPNDGNNNIVTVLDVNGRQFTVRTGTGADDESTADDPLVVASNCYGYNAVNDGWNRLRTTEAADGYRLIVSVSGQPVNATVSLGATPTSGDAARISGQLVAVSGIVNIGNSPVVLVSGQTVSVSGTVAANVSGATVSVSGIIRLAIPTAIRTRAELACTALSGGTQLLSGDVRKATILNAGSAGTIMFIGSTTDPPFSGFGFRLVAGNGLTIETTNFDRIRAFAATSGGFISYIGEQY